MTQTTSDFLSVDGGTLYYEVAGEGETLVLSHAAFLDSRMFDEQWEMLAQHYRVIRYDMRGYGRSNEVSGPLCRRNDLRQLLAHLSVTRAHLVGCSNGGQIMLDLALETPALAASLTLVNSTPGGFAMEGEMPPIMFEMFEALQQGHVNRASELQIQIWLDSSARQPQDIDAALREKALLMNHIPVSRKTFLIADMGAPVNPLMPPAVTRLHNVPCPTLIIVGALDHAEVLRAADIMAANMPQARKVLIENAGHVPSYEHADLFNNLLLNFLRGETDSPHPPM